MVREGGGQTCPGSNHKWTEQKTEKQKAVEQESLLQQPERRVCEPRTAALMEGELAPCG